jgi:hypothetical protein
LTRAMVRAKRYAVDQGIIVTVVGRHHQVEDRCVGLVLLCSQLHHIVKLGDTSSSTRYLRSSSFCRDRDVAGITNGRRSTYGYSQTAIACSGHGGSC